MASGEKIIPINIEDEMKTAYIDYSMSVIVSRALPDVRDGLKPVHRRVLYGMSGLGLTYNKSFKKSARIVGEVLGKYHPHGDSSVYDTMVRMAQHWSLRYPLVDGQGNFGSVDGDSPAAMRYTEARLRRISDEMLADIDKDTVNFRLNFDDSLEEPTVLPTKFPNLLVNGASGIAVGMATNMLPHNLSEIIDGTIALIDNHEITIDELCQFVKAPDFPTGGIIYGVEGVREAFATGRGRVVVRGKADIEETGSGRERIIITEIPYQLNKANLIIRIAELVNNGKIEGISDVRDESDRKGMRIVVEVKRDAMASVVLSKLYKFTPLQSSYGVNNIALVNGRPQLLNLKQIIEEFVKFRLEVITRRTQYDLNKAEERAHILKGLLLALDYLDAVISLIRGSKNAEEARNGLIHGDFLAENEKAAALEKLGIEANAEGNVLSEPQARAILEMRLQKLTGLEREKLKEEYDELMKLIAHLNSILASEQKKKDIIKEELTDIKDRYGDERRTRIEFAAGDISIEDMIANEEVVVTVSHLGYLKRTKADEYRKQGRGGRGSRGSKTRSEDYIEHMFVAETHDWLLFFTEQGRCFWLRVYEIPEGGKTFKGRVLQNILSIPKDDKVKAYIVIKDLTDREFLDSHNIILCTKMGKIKKTSVEAFSRPRSNGINAITINEGDQLLEAKLTTGHDEILIAVSSGRAIRFNEEKVRPMGRTAAGVKAITVEKPGDEVIGMVCVSPDDENASILVVSEKGNGKRSALEDYRITNRGGKGVITLKVNEKIGRLIAIKSVTDLDDLLIINKSGIVIRMALESLRVMGRATQGVRLINLNDGDEIADVTLIKNAGLEVEEENGQEGEEVSDNESDSEKPAE
ncbi:MAG: DNA gyrase subunit A [Bacteroidota bacterium]